MRKSRHHYILRSVVISALVYILLIITLAFNAIYTPIPEEEEGIFIELEDFIPIPIDLNQITEGELNSEDRRNIAVNKAMNSQKETDPYDYSDIKESDDSYKEQLVKDALSEEEYKKIFERDDMNLEENIEEQEVNKEVDETNEKPSNFQGATYITYFLKDRYKMKIPVPTYRCETSGKVTINITVNRDGKVVSYEITENSTKDECLRSAAIRSARSSKFNQNYDTVLKQKGSISYIFEAQ